MRTTGNTAALATRVSTVIASLPGARVNDSNSAQRASSSSLTAIDLHGLTGLELVFAVLLVAGATGLIFVLGIAERQRTSAIFVALGPQEISLGHSFGAEVRLIQVGGGVLGVVLGFGIAQMPVKVLTGVFDPPPESLSVPWLYLALLTAIATATTVGTVLSAQAATRRPIVETLRNL